MNQNELAIEANKHIHAWAQGVDKLVVAIDGYVGVGKTTLVDNLAKLNSDIVFIHQDDFLLAQEQIEELLAKADDRSKVFELEVRDNKKLEEVIKLFRTNEPKKRILVIDGVFMFHPLNLNHLWNRRIYLTSDLQKIDERRVKREKERWGEKYFPETHPDSHFKQVTTALKRYQQEFEPEKLADLVLRVD